MNDLNEEPRTFTEDAEPPFGERIYMQDPDGWQFTWTGKRWHAGWGEAHLCYHEAWPPDCDGPFVEVREVPRG